MFCRRGCDDVALTDAFAGNLLPEDGGKSDWFTDEAIDADTFAISDTGTGSRATAIRCRGLRGCCLWMKPFQGNSSKGCRTATKRAL